MMAMVTLTLAGCDLGNVGKSKSEDVRTRTFDRKKQCAEIGRAFYQRDRAEFERILGEKRTWPADTDDGPYCAYNVDRDTCLVSWVSTTTVQRPDCSFSRGTYGYLYDALTGELIAHYDVMTDQEGKVVGTVTSSAESFRQTRRTLMGFDPE